MKKIKVALAGFGKGGRIYNAPVISSVEGFEIHKIMTSSQENIEAAKQDYPGAVVVQNFSEITNDPEVDLVVILTPNHLHKDFAIKALQAEKHVVAEKPFTPTTEDADELIALAQKKNKILSVNHNRRWDSDFLTIEKLVRENRLGKVVEFESHFDRFRAEVKDSWKEQKEIPGSGILYDLGSHLIHQALVLFGNPTELFADLRIQRENSEVTDNFELLLFYPELKITLKAGMLVKEKGPTYSVFGRKGTFLKYGVDVQEEALKNGQKPEDLPNWGKEPEKIWGKLNTIDREYKIESEQGDYRKLYQNVYAAITGQDDLIITPEEARDVIKIIELAEQSSIEKRVLPFE